MRTPVLLAGPALAAGMLLTNTPTALASDPITLTADWAQVDSTGDGSQIHVGYTYTCTGLGDGTQATAGDAEITVEDQAYPKGNGFTDDRVVCDNQQHSGDVYVPTGRAKRAQTGDRVDITIVISQLHGTEPVSTTVRRTLDLRPPQ
ncbi:hypothetical protein [Streptomyces luteireticuli]|uniref:hypothetical protein n=1 Tax=Streptomyces luteireticuli TaxID=173858 RepID=UPI003557F9B5